MSGDLRGVDLYQLVQEQFSHTFSGTASVHLVRAKIHNGRLVNAAGSLKSSGGTIGRRLLEAAADRWNLILHNVADGAVIRFAAMDIGFEFDESTIRLTGNCGELGTSWIVTDTGNPILSSHGVTTAPILSLVRVLVTQSDVQVPLTRETANLLSVFPIPAVKRSSDNANQPPSTTLRLEDSSFR
ncbi:MAG: hypothetical protein IH991_17425 [Planctomycetes bacterium]|nr:hypothetical protein [Planctomycetota bacterium]